MPSVDRVLNVTPIGPRTEKEDAALGAARKMYGAKWEKVVACLPGRTQSAVRQPATPSRTRTRSRTRPRRVATTPGRTE